MPFLRPLGYIPTSNPSDGAYLYLNAANGLETRDHTGAIRTYATGVTPEEVQDIIGSSFIDSATIDFTYDDVLNQMFASVNQGAIDHTNIANKGTNTHAQIDSHIGSTSNPHSVTKTQVGLANVPNVDATNPANIAQDATHRFATDTEKTTWNAKEPAIINPNDTSKYYRGDKTWATLDKSAVGLGNVPNVDATSRANHTGTQLAATISDFNTAADARVTSGINAHVALADPHTQYATPAEITSAVSAHAATTNHPIATITTQGMMSATDKVKLDGVTSPVVLANTSYPSNSSNVTLVNIAELQFNVVSGRRYKIEVDIPYSSAQTAAGIAIALATLGGSSGQLSGRISSMTAAGTMTSQLINAFNTVYTFTTSANTTNNYAEIRATFICFSSGQIVPQFRSEVNGQQIQIIGNGFVSVLEV
jgi:hypothetical protein